MPPARITACSWPTDAAENAASGELQQHNYTADDAGSSRVKRHYAAEHVVGVLQGDQCARGPHGGRAGCAEHREKNTPRARKNYCAGAEMLGRPLSALLVSALLALSCARTKAEMSLDVERDVEAIDLGEGLTPSTGPGV